MFNSSVATAVHEGLAALREFSAEQLSRREFALVQAPELQLENAKSQRLTIQTFESRMERIKDVLTAHRLGEPADVMAERSDNDR